MKNETTSLFAYHSLPSTLIIFLDRSPCKVNDPLNANVVRIGLKFILKYLQICDNYFSIFCRLYETMQHGVTPDYHLSD